MVSTSHPTPIKLSIFLLHWCLKPYVMVDCFTPCQQLRICNSDPTYENIWKPDSALYNHPNVWAAVCVNEGDNLTRTKWERDIKKLGAESKCGEFKIYILH